MSRTKIYFASDAHLGARFHKDPQEVERRLVRWLDSIKDEAKAIYFLGDVFDFWFEYKHVVPKGYVRFLGKLAELSDSGIEIHLFLGNHDMWMFDYLEKEIGATIHREPLVVDLDGKRFYLSHGDEAYLVRPGYKLIYTLFRNKWCQKLFAMIHPRLAFGFARGWSLQSRKSGIKREEEVNYNGEDSEELVLFAKRYLEKDPSINFFIFGHRHIMLDLMLSRSARIIIAGDWMQYFSYVEFDGEDLFLDQFELE